MWVGGGRLNYCLKVLKSRLVPSNQPRNDQQLIGYGHVCDIHIKSSHFRVSHCILLDSSTVILGRVHWSFYGCRVYFTAFILFLWKILLGNNVDPDLDLQCLPMTLLRVSG